MHALSRSAHSVPKRLAMVLKSWKWGAHPIYRHFRVGLQLVKTQAIVALDLTFMLAKRSFDRLTPFVRSKFPRGACFGILDYRTMYTYARWGQKEKRHDSCPPELAMHAGGQLAFLGHIPWCWVIVSLRSATMQFDNQPICTIALIALRNKGNGMVSTSPSLLFLVLDSQWSL